MTGAIVALNVAVFVMMAALLGSGWFEAKDMTPYILYGANNAAATTDGQWWRLLTSMFMHFGILHLALNMWALLQAGKLVERLQGRALYAATYLGSGLGGGFLSMAWHGDKIWSAGASGAIFGVYGALLGHILRDKLALPKAVLQPLMRSTLLFAGYNLLYGLANPAIDNGAHIGGFVTGFALGWLTAPPPGMDRAANSQGRRLAIAAAAITLLIVVGVATAPRYDYSVRDELAWQRAVRPFASEDPALEARQNTALAAWISTRSNGEECRRLIEGTMVPLYAKLAETIDALPLSPGRLTDRRRRAFSAFAHLRLEAYPHLLQALSRNDVKEFESYSELNERAAKAVDGFQDSREPSR